MIIQYEYIEKLWYETIHIIGKGIFLVCCIFFPMLILFLIVLLIVYV
jgi:hypothetical protein